MHYPSVQFVLVEGNHDILHNDMYALPNLIKTDVLEEERFIFSHHPLNQVSKINFCGHIHPGIKISGTAKQAATLACFCLKNNQLILPAFGHLTGLHLLDHEEGTEFYLVAHSRVVHYKNNL
jgi:metallophosphoesterase superfamily enzyme